jgi:lipoprotein-anchoring transpeptidase ErfK/SrfK
MPWNRRQLAMCVCIALFSMSVGAGDGVIAAQAAPPPLALEFAQEVVPLRTPPADVVGRYALALDAALEGVGFAVTEPRFVVLVDRNPGVQTLLLFWGSGKGWRLVGAAPVSTGLPGRFDHFETPLGVFEHVVDNPDFRAEGTRNALGIRGYGRKGSRIYDFGWVIAPKGWGDRASMAMRLQMHATDPDRLERRLGTAQSKGCIRIPASLNAFLDRHAILDEDYEAEMARGRRFWVLREDRSPTPWSGRYLVVVDSRQSAPTSPFDAPVD